MRGEIFESQYSEPVKKNEYISDDLNTLQEHYTIMLEYVRKLEKDNIKLRNENERLIRRMKVLRDEYGVEEREEAKPK